jgi:hypothetical protein
LEQLTRHRPPNVCSQSVKERIFLAIEAGGFDDDADGYLFRTARRKDFQLADKSNQ